MKYNEHVDKDCKLNEIPTIKNLIKLELAKVSSKYINNLYSNAILTLFEASSHQYETRNKNVPRIKRHNNSLYNSSFLCKSAYLWLALPRDMKEKDNTKAFGYNAKRHYINGPSTCM